MIKYINFENFSFNLVEVVLNNACPLDCTYCFLENQGEQEFMNTQTLQEIFQLCKYSMEINPREFISIMFSLKEPLVSWTTIEQTFKNLDFDPIDYNIFCTINTNGVLLTEDIYNFCTSHNISLHISLDGPKDIHDEERVYRGKHNQQLSSWEKVMDIIHKYPNAPLLSYMCTLNKKNLHRTQEIFEFLSSLPISNFVYSLNKFDDWDDESLNILENYIKNFINNATPQQLNKTRFENTAASFPNLNVTNSIKIIQNGNINLQPPILNDGSTKGAFCSRVDLGNVNKQVIIPKQYQNTTYLDYVVVGKECSTNCELYNICKQNINGTKLYVDDFSCKRLRHFKRMALYASGGNMTDTEYNNIIQNTSLFNAVINITDNCNLRCPYCFTEHNTRVIDLGTIKSAIMFIIRQYENKKNTIKTDRKPGFTFFGGEPMLHFEDIIKPIVLWTESSGLREKYKITFSMTTNGTLLTEDNLHWLSEHNISILLSMDGDKPTQDSQRPAANEKSSFDMIVPNIPYILKYYPMVTFRSAIEPYNADKIFQNYLFARKNNFMNYFITPNIGANWDQNTITTAMEQLSLIAQVMYQDISQGVVPLVWNEIFTNMKEIFYNRSNENISFHHCGIGTNSIGIATNGDLYGCQEHNTYINHDIFYIGDIFTGIDIKKHKRLLSEFAKEKHPVCKEQPDRCKVCRFYHNCASHYCPSHNLINNRGAIENNLITCVWKEFVYNLAYTLLEWAEAENNQVFLKFLEHKITPDNEFSVW